MRLPDAILRHTVTVETYLGDGAGGPVYAEPVEVACWVEPKRQEVTTGGVVQTTSAVLLAQLDQRTVLVTGSRVRAPDGTSTWVADATPRDAGGLPLPEHVECALA